MSFDLSESNKKILWTVLAASGVASATYYLFLKDRSIHALLDEKWQLQYLLSAHKLKEIAKHIQADMDRGLRAERSTLKMLPSYVGKPTGQENGVYLALDLGGTNFRVIKCALSGSGVVSESSMKKFALEESHMKGTAENLFDFIARCVQEFIVSEKLENQDTTLGFTFSFPVQQTSVNSGTLIQWTKGFATTGCEGQDVVRLLNEAFARNNVKVHVAALANDTVGTMVTKGYDDPKTEMGVILGTGTNACYAEKGKNIAKMGPNTPDQIINMEWGGFGDKSTYLPLSVEDRLLDAASIHPGQQIFEKMISGYYLGEISRLFICSLIEREVITSISIYSLVQKSYKFDTAFLSTILKDDSRDLSGVQSVLSENFAIKGVSLHDLKIVRRVAELVTTRAARLSATAIVAVLEKINRLNDVTVAIDGSVFEHVPRFKQTMEHAIKELHPLSNVRLELARDGSGNGAAIIASTLARSL